MRTVGAAANVYKPHFGTQSEKQLPARMNGSRSVVAQGTGRGGWLVGWQRLAHVGAGDDVLQQAFVVCAEQPKAFAQITRPVPQLEDSRDGPGEQRAGP